MWEVRVVGQIFHQKWTNLGVRWSMTDDSGKDPGRGIHLYVNGGLVARSLRPIGVTFTNGGPKCAGVARNRAMTLGCAWDGAMASYSMFGSGQYDELAIWSRKLVVNGTLNELPYLLGGYCEQIDLVDSCRRSIMIEVINHQQRIAFSPKFILIRFSFILQADNYFL